MKVTLWGTRGSLASPGPDTTRYGGNTSCVAIEGSEGSVLVLDAGTGIRRLGAALPPTLRRVDILLTHLHMDHIQGLAFFAPLRTPGIEAHIWGPASTTLTLKARLGRYLSPPLFPVYLRELGATQFLHEVPCNQVPCYDFEIGEFRVSTALVNHVDPTVGFRIESSKGSVVYLPDHEPALGVRNFPLDAEWTSGFELAAGADLLIHDAQYSVEEYAQRVGFGHSSIPQAFDFATLTEVKHFVPFHHDPTHSDADLDRLIGEAIAATRPAYAVTPGIEGVQFDL
jgi:phosphoribosyl 1,2-cyclic phosphodiesterase